MQPSSKKILVVEDEILIGRDLISKLTKLGYTVVGHARNSNDALMLAGKEKPDLVLMDIGIEGDRDGVDTAVILWKKYGIGCIFITGMIDDETIGRAKEAEPLGYINKPFSEKEVALPVEIALHKSIMQQRLRENEKWLDTTLNSLGDGVIATDEDGHIRLMNPVAELLTGWNARDVVGYDLDEVFRIYNENTFEPADDPLRKMRQIRRTVSSGEDVMLQSLAGSWFPVSYTLSPIKNDKSHLIGAVVIFRDQRERRKTEELLAEKEQRWRDLLQHSSDVILMVGLEGDIRFASPSVKTVLGYEPRQLEGKLIRNYLTEPDRLPFLEVLQTMIKANKDRDKLTFGMQRGDKSVVYLEGVFSIGEAGIVLNARDVSDQSRINQELNDARLRAERANRFKSAFLSNLGHDIRSPMTGILGFAEILLSESDNDEHRHMLEQMLERGQKLIQKLEAVLDLARIESGTVVPETELLDPADVLAEAAEMASAAAAEKNIRLKVTADPSPVFIMADRRLLVQAVCNVLHFSVSGMTEGRIHLSVQPGNEVAGKERRPVASITIKDNGMGLSEAYTHRFLGSGEATGAIPSLGTLRDTQLSVAIESVRMMDGRFSLSSKPGKGTTFEIVFSATPAPKPTGKKGKKRTSAADQVVDEQFSLEERPFRVLLVEDDKETRQLLERYLAAFCEPIPFETATEALDYVNTHSADLLVLDIKLEGDINGTELLARIREIKGYEKVPAMAITAYNARGDRETFLNAGFDRYIGKPVRKDTFVLEVKKALLGME